MGLREVEGSVEEKGLDGPVFFKELQDECTKTLKLLEDPQPGLMTWHEFMRNRLENLHQLTGIALGKKK